MELPAFRSRFPSQSVRIGNLKWTFIRSRPKGAAPSLLMLPGTLGSAEIFWNQFSKLHGKVDLLAVTYPQITDIARLADSLRGLLARLGIERCAVVGSSLGGYLAQILASRHPHIVDRLFIGNSLSDPKARHRASAPVSELLRQPASFHRDMILQSVESWPMAKPAQQRLRDILFESGTRLLSAKALKARVLMLRLGPTVPRLPIDPGRIEIIDCADDPLIPRAIQDDVVRRYPRAKHHRLRFGGHYPYILAADRYTGILARGLGLTA